MKATRLSVRTHTRNTHTHTNTHGHTHTNPQSQGQRVRTYTVEYTAPGAPTEWLPFANGTCVGNKRIELLSVPIKAGQVRLNVTSGIAYPVIKEFAVFAPCLSA